ncbi:Threonine-phosphate decarboxylase [Bosea sp. 62]|uniref:threonine-phosphate decarboxylase CobD n=1 Tax=unclassified Bosea (in: a-proteobacteria) TaxID=2653178 RepID=UPI00125330F1|nr:MULTISPECIES: threonine-phosphate decarboxylase CobD [unclassified Bosea (in: a-proteobacteria)]CAD5288570.1 Threonine-phosphate decarboxylase [Bosea sp. 21B]CAD5290875.1 Threonine-phosphate decarboxylase [Bosea sp. 46]CAD5300818.1 Threonine-phosphate decarboxylase [Bosea sp. 7B]VVT60337.1 Threonine-phosphate decarboxylase [Bosea sp. EC-HK365B]VXA96274.1 Threonine-phosphate decarboxylase [Bosea sp. 62]
MAAGEMKETIWHGGDLATVKALFPQVPEPWIDLSTGINPIPYPLPELPLSLWHRLPGKADEARLLAAARKAYRIRPQSGLVAAPGTQILIELLPRLVPAATVAVLGPTYGEHASAWRKAGATVREIADLAEAGDANVVVLVNPNNPDGRVVAQERLVALAGLLGARGGLLVVDEAFADFAPAMSLLPILPEGALVLRSFGKAYGLAGLRLGFAAGEVRFTDALQAMLGPWAVAGPALHVGAVALGDAEWLSAAGEARDADSRRLDALLAPLGRVVGGTVLYRLLETLQAPALFDRLGRAGIYVRRFQHNPSRLRFGLPGDEAGWSRLAQALTPA